MDQVLVFYGEVLQDITGWTRPPARISKDQSRAKMLRPPNKDVPASVHGLAWRLEYIALKQSSRQFAVALVLAVFGFLIALGSDVFGVATAIRDWLGIGADQ